MDPRLQYLIDSLRGAPEATASLLSGAVAQPLAGLAGLSQGVSDLATGKGLAEALRSGSERVERAQEGLTYTPRSGAGQQSLSEAGALMEPVGRALEYLPGKLGEASPAGGAGLAGLMAVMDPTKVAGKAGRAGAMVARSKPVLQAAGLEPDMLRSFLSDPKYKAGVPADVIGQAKANRAEYRQEPPTLPKKATEMSPEDWAAFGQTHGVDLSQSPMQSLGVSDLKTKREIQVPGGLEGRFTIPDLFAIKGNNFDPAALGTDTHNALMAKFLRTYERPHGSSPVDIFNDLNFSLMSPNAPLTQNEFLAQRFRLKDMGELASLAERAAPPGDKGARTALARSLDQEAGVGAASRGGLGVGGTADLSSQAELARLILEKPEMFVPGEGETLRDVGFRVMNQVPGLSVKTASLGVPWTDLGKANTSAVDLHMIRHAYPRLASEDPGFAARLAERPAGMGEEERAINIIGGGHPEAVYRTKQGELHPDLPAHLAPEKLAYEPDKWTRPNDYYSKIMDYIDESRQQAATPHELFPEQWRKWDVYRGRVEPHEMAHPDWAQLPRQSFSELQDALTAHKEAGYTSTPAAGLYPSDVGVQPVPKQTDWRSLYYGRADPTLLAGTAAAAGGGAALMSKLLRQQSPPSPDEPAPEAPYGP